MTKSMFVDSCFHYNIAKHLLQICVAYCFEEERLFPVMFGKNKQGGMDSEEFAEYFLGSILPLYLTACNKPGHCVMLKLDSGPGRINFISLHGCGD
jgi:hypothetical protein